MEKPLWIRVSSEADVTRSVLEARRSADALGFGSNVCALIATAASELSRNILKYAGSGEIIISPIQDSARKGIEITARDRGPGIADIDEAMSERFSSSGTLGLGLPGVKRMMDEFEIESIVGKGTKVLVRKWQ